MSNEYLVILRCMNVTLRHIAVTLNLFQGLIYDKRCRIKFGMTYGPTRPGKSADEWMSGNTG